MQLKQVKRRFLTAKERFCTKLQIFYAKKGRFSANKEKYCAKVNLNAQFLIKFKISSHVMSSFKKKFKKNVYLNEA